ncbi:hypothetical protein MTR67_044381 [Solanum verrucosum]|uniref:Uncharacterized protein n=1 Tax=Solanum verrucosum TaxID=315347 RepID=A0AAF0UTU2_SOLVR|nr:hypothetical protein MTR67_044381 [Solanum verrucosum]
MRMYYLVYIVLLMLPASIDFINRLDYFDGIFLLLQSHYTENTTSISLVKHTVICHICCIPTCSASHSSRFRDIADVIAGDSLQLENKKTTHTQQPAGSAGASSLSTAHRDCFNFRRKLYIQASQSTTFTYIPHVIAAALGPLFLPSEITKSPVSACSMLSQKHRKQKCSSGMEENPNNLPAQQTTSDKNLHRSTRYAQMSPDRKQLLLSQLRAKRAESKRQKTLHQSNSTAALTITTSSLSPQQASKPTNVPSTSTRREHIVTCLSTFKQGQFTDIASTISPIFISNNYLAICKYFHSVK